MHEYPTHLLQKLYRYLQPVSTFNRSWSQQQECRDCSWKVEGRVKMLKLNAKEELLAQHSTTTSAPECC